VYALDYYMLGHFYHPDVCIDALHHHHRH
jgi:hypothetical protein